MEKNDQRAQNSASPADIRSESRSQKPESAIPRFASFKPRQSRPSTSREKSRSLPEPAPTSSRKATSPAGNAAADRKHEPRNERLNRRDRRDRREQDRHEYGRALTPQKHKLLYDVAREDGRPFVEDRRSDENNIRYGRLHRYEVTRYREAGRRRILGLSRSFRTIPESDAGRRLVTNEWADTSHRDERKLLRTAPVEKLASSRVVASAGNDSEADASCDYLSLSPRNGRKRRKLRNPCSPPSDILDDHSHVDERVVEYSTSSDSEKEPTSVSSAFNEARDRRVQLSRSVKETPRDVSAWLALIQHEDVMVADGTEQPGGALTKAQQRGLADVKLSMYEQALSKTRGHPEQHRLVHGMMTEVARIWDTKKLAKQWKAVLKEYPNDLHLWTRYLNFEQTNSVTFNYDSYQASLKNCLQMIATKDASADVELTNVYLFLRLTTFMNEAGFSEHAHGLWQAILEFSFFQPNSDQVDDELSSLENFWDSEVPRLGEVGASGWNMARSVDVEPRSDPPLAMVLGRDLIEFWSQRERQRMMTSLLPARTLDDIDVNDPYRIVLFSDIQPFLFRPSSAEARRQLLEAYLCFSDLPPLQTADLSKHSFSKDPFLTNGFLEATGKTLDDWLNQDMSDPFGFPMSSFIVDITSLFVSRERWFDPWGCDRSLLAEKRRSDWILRSLRQLHGAFSEDELFAEYAIAFEWQLDGREAQRYAKRLLKKQPSVRLYNVFALLEDNSGNTEGAEHVWSSTLNMRTAFPSSSRHDTILIWRCWMWTLLDRHDFSRALRLLLSFPDEKIALSELDQAGTVYLDEHPTSKLRALQCLAETLRRNLSLKTPDLSIHCLDVLALLTYLTSNQTLPASMVHYTTVSAHATITQSRSALCLLHQSRARLLHLHTKTSYSGFRPADITAPLAESIRLFPNNTIFLSLYHFHTRRSLLTDRIRDVTPILSYQWKRSSSDMPSTDEREDGNGSNECIVPPLFQIWTELNRPSFAGSTSHCIRAAFENHLSFDTKLDSQGPGDSGSLSPSQARHSPTAWKLYILWEISAASKSHQYQQDQTDPIATTSHSSNDKTDQMATAVQVFHRATRACPWAKEIYMLAFEKPELREAMTLRELRAVREMMMDRDLRLHVGLGAGEGAA